jgi:hypothetical protein
VQCPPAIQLLSAWLSSALMPSALMSSALMSSALMSSALMSSAPTERNTIAQGKKRSAVALGQQSTSPKSPEGATESRRSKMYGPAEGSSSGIAGKPSPIELPTSFLSIRHRIRDCVESASPGGTLTFPGEDDRPPVSPGVGTEAVLQSLVLLFSNHSACLN